jgi:hypothetical protein
LVLLFGMAGRAAKMTHSGSPGAGKEMTQEKKSRWKLPLGVVATGVAGAAVLVLRGCWHRKMSWPVRYQQHSYQVCLGCGIKRLFDEKTFCAYGPYSYDLNRLIARDTAARVTKTQEPAQRPA